MVPYGDQFNDIRIPVLTITGYYDDGQISALQYFKEHLRHRPDADHALLIGPYDHRGAQSALKPMELRDYAVDPAAQFDTRQSPSSGWTMCCAARRVLRWCPTA